MPDEGDRHSRTWMCFIASTTIWARRQINEVHRNLASIATTIAKYEPVSILVSAEDYNLAVDLLGGLDSHKHAIELIKFNLDDLWMRDTGPIFVKDDSGQRAAINFNFNGWGNKQDHQNDRLIADFVAATAGVDSVSSKLVLEGGCFEVDGAGTAIMTESCIINDNRNPGKSKSDIEAQLMALLGLEKIIWLKGSKGKDITDGHTDFYARFARPGVIIASLDTDESSYDYGITRDNIEVLKAATDAQGRPLQVISLDTPWEIETRYGTANFAAGYVGYYLCNNALIMQKFGDRDADALARQRLAQVFPQRTIVQLAINGIASGGGSIHCSTQQEISLA
ncbi:MAG: agmatine deiminase [SAR86 cluster bacterium]|uniref:Agmatine deiminase n=1 Tax=SAR86 cluster bacterium TaxID=2030880 RepID=A0A2A4MRX3_9GAMM|nr:MAG: agmatine deiminase [SAR86 cluster bacterium]